MTTITIEQGSKQGSYRGEDGTYTATLTSVEVRGPFDSKQPKFPGEQFSLYEWAFAIEGAPEDSCMVWASSSTRVSPKSKAFGYITALLGGKQPPVGTELDIEKHLVGREALVTVFNDPATGFTDVTQVTAIPKVATAKAAAPKAPPTDSDLPF
jgi:hypothetical protein